MSKVIFWGQFPSISRNVRVREASLMTLIKIQIIQVSKNLTSSLCLVTRMQRQKKCWLLVILTVVVDMEKLPFRSFYWTSITAKIGNKDTCALFCSFLFSLTFLPCHCQSMPIELGRSNLLNLSYLVLISVLTFCLCCLILSGGFSSWFQQPLGWAVLCDATVQSDAS